MKTLKELAMVQLLQARLSSDSRTCGQTIDVLVEDGEVFLVGMCDDAQSKETARMIVNGTYGVRTVVDQLSVRVKRTIASV
jgi:osmotically-inducible protein OsmY